MKLLLIEDNPGDVRLVKELLYDTTDIKIEHAWNLTSGKKFLDSHQVDVVLLDLGLPESRGLETLRLLQERINHLPVVVMTSVDDEAQAIHGVQQGAQDYLVKGQVDGKLLRRSLIYAIERKRLQEALHRSQEAQRASEEKYRWIFDTANEGICVSDAEGKIMLVNRRMAEMVGYAIKEMIGRSISDFVRPEAAAGPGKQLHKPGRGAAEQYELAVRRKDGSTFWAIVNASPMNDAGNRYIGQLSMFTDITERKKIDVLKDDFIGMVSHELKTPLTVVIGSLHTSQIRGIAADEKRQLLDEALASADNLADILDNLLELSRFQANRVELQKEKTDIGQVATSTVNRLRGRSGIHRLTLDIPSNLPQAHVDQIRVARLLHNLVDNAIKYSPGGGEVKIFARHENSRLVVGVKDQGSGISIEDQAKLFDRFQRLDKTGTGTPGVGLGLHVCRLLVEAHGGRIWVESQAGGGATFRFTLPVA